MEKDPKFEADDHARIFKYKKIKEVKKTVLQTYVISDLNDEDIVGTFYEKKFKRQIKQNLGQKK